MTASPQPRSRRLARHLATALVPVALFFGSFAISSAVMPHVSTMTYVPVDAGEALAAPQAPDAETAEPMARHGCSADGLADGVIPAHAIVEDPAGEVSLTSFDESWAVYTGDAPSTLVAVCAR